MYCSQWGQRTDSSWIGRRQYGHKTVSSSSSGKSSSGGSSHPSPQSSSTVTRRGMLPPDDVGATRRYHRGPPVAARGGSPVGPFLLRRILLRLVLLGRFVLAPGRRGGLG